MPFTHRTGYVNPRLGNYFGIFMSAFLAIALLLVIFEALGAPSELLKLGIFAGPFLLYAVIGLSAYANEPLDYFASGRRVPAFYSGLVLAQTAMGATGLLALTGTFFLVGFDALCIVIGGLAGFVVMAIMLAPFYRKFGAFTLPTYLGRRFDSLALRLISAAVIAVPMVLMMAAELQMGAYAAQWITGLSRPATILLLAALLVVVLAAGGVRSLAWSTAAQSIAALLAVMIPVAIVAVIVTNLPLPQLSAGPVLRQLARGEAAQGLPIILPPLLAFDIPGSGLSAIGKRFSDAFGSVGPISFVIVMLTVMMGVASAPWLLPRVASTPGVYETRKSLGWATLLFGVSMLTLASVGILMRDYLMDIVTVPGQVRFPAWFQSLRDAGLISVSGETSRPQLSSFSVDRDAVLLMLPSAAELPAAFVFVVASGAIAAALATAGSLALALGNVLGEDLVFGRNWLPAQPGRRLFISRMMLGVAAAVGALVAIVLPGDPLSLMLWAFAFCAASIFPALILSIWWKRLNTYGAVAGMLTGFGVTALALLAGEGSGAGLDGALAAAIGLPAGAVAAITVAYVTPAPGRHLLELVRDIRVPGGEILYDREMRTLKRQKNQRASAT